MYISYISLILLVFVTPQGESKYACDTPYVCKATSICAEEQKHGTMRNRVLFPCASGKVCCPPRAPPLIQPSVLNIVTTTQKNPAETDFGNESQSQVQAPVPSVQPLVLKADLTSHRNFNLIPRYCGLVLNNKITGGENASAAEFPWMALIGFEGITSNGNREKQFVCGGTLIADFYVLTAAHCILREGSSLSHVRLGEFDMEKDIDCNGSECYKPAVDIQVEEIIMHEHYNNRTYRNDIALIRISSNATALASSSIAPICLPWNSLNIKEGYKYEAAGWGLTGYREHALSDILKKVRLSGVSLESCNSVVCPSSNAESPYCPIQSSQICVQGARRKDVCKGDSGGPLMSTTYFATIQLGITSIKTTEVCGEANVPSIFTRVESYLPWILDHIKK